MYSANLLAVGAAKKITMNAIGHVGVQAFIQIEN